MVHGTIRTVHTTHEEGARSNNLQYIELVCYTEDCTSYGRFQPQYFPKPTKMTRRFRSCLWRLNTSRSAGRCLCNFTSEGGDKSTGCWEKRSRIWGRVFFLGGGGGGYFTKQYHLDILLNIIMNWYLSKSVYTILRTFHCVTIMIPPMNLKDCSSWRS